MDVNGMLAIIFFFVTVGVVVGSIIFTRHQERMGIIEKGLKAEDVKGFFHSEAHQWSPLTSLKWGMILVAVGLAIIVAMTLHNMYNVEHGIYPALIALFGGIALVVYYAIANRKERL